MRKFINGFSAICKPLHVLTQKDQKFLWNDECQDAFEKLKVALTTAPVLGFPRESGGIFICDADASKDALGSVLSQEQDGQERVIAYYSKCFNKAERRYCTTRRELLSVACSIKHFLSYLHVYGRHFKVRSDHGSLRWLMNFKICEGALARILETLAIYDFEIEFRPGSRHLDANSVSRRPCVDQECAHCERFEKRYSEETNPRLATRNIGLLCEESVKQGESQLRVERLSNTDQKLETNCTPGDSLCEVSMCLEQGPLQTQCFEKETESLSTGGIRPNTSPTPGGPKIVTEWSLPQIETDQSEGTIEKCEESHGCDSIRVSEETREKQLEPRPSVETQLSCNSRVCKTTLGGSLGVDESQDPFKLHCAEETDSESSYYDCEEEIERFNEEGCQENQSKSAYVRNTEAVNIDCLTPQNIKYEQDRQPEIQMIKEWKRDGKRPDWSQVA